MSKVAKDLMNDKLKAEIIRRVFPNGDEVGCHKFELGRETCKQCSTKFWDWVEQQPNGDIAVGAKLCNVIGRDEVARFRDVEW